MQRLQAAFATEAAEHCEALSTGLLELERGDDSRKRALIETMFRGAHSLKGAARAMNLVRVEEICQRLETVFVAWRRSEPRITLAMFDTLHRAVDAIRVLVQAPLAPGSAAA